MIIKCTNKSCPIKDKCKRNVAKDAPSEQKYNFFQYEAVKNKEGIIVGYICQFQKFV